MFAIHNSPSNQAPPFIRFWRACRRLILRRSRPRHVRSSKESSFTSTAVSRCAADAPPPPAPSPAWTPPSPRPSFSLLCHGVVTVELRAQPDTFPAAAGVLILEGLRAHATEGRHTDFSQRRTARMCVVFSFSALSAAYLQLPSRMERSASNSCIDRRSDAMPSSPPPLTMLLAAVVGAEQRGQPRHEKAPATVVDGLPASRALICAPAAKGRRSPLLLPTPSSPENPKIPWATSVRRPLMTG